MVHVQRYLGELTYASNLLTLSRLLLLPPTLYFLRRQGTTSPALMCLGAAMLTDALDGMVARQQHTESRLGKVLDPLIDKLFLNSVALALVARGFPRWMVALLLFRDVGIVLAAGVLLLRRNHIAVANWSGKASTTLLTIALLVYTIDGPRSGRPVLLLALVPFGLSFWHYGTRFIGALHAP
jgi:CDP-diacylglycerol--glycerol-3-phosphate 3-phosphatidyltransferase